SDALAIGASYAPITITFDVSAGLSGSVSNVATVSGGGELNTTNDSATDRTPILLASTLTLSASPNPSTAGQVVSITASVIPGATGRVYFYDGLVLIGSAPVSGTQAIFNTSLLLAGSHTLRAYYPGDSVYGIGFASAALTVNPIANTGFRPGVNYPVGG